MQLGRMLIAEAIGTYLLVLFGAGAVATDVVTGGQLGLWPVGFIGGFGVTVGIYATVAISGAHLNPAISLAFAVFRRSEFPVGRMVSYWGAQLAGAFAAGLTLFAVFSPFVERLERLNGYIRGAPGSEYSAMIFSKHFPDPGTFGIDEAARSLLSAPAAAAIEGFGTAILAFVIFAVFDRRNTCADEQQPGPAPGGIDGRHTYRHVRAADPCGLESCARLRSPNRCVLRGLGQHRHTGADRRLLGIHRRPARGRSNRRGGV